MERLPMRENAGSPRQQGQNQQSGPPPVPQGPPQLPPQMFTTAAQLLDLTDSTNLLLRRGMESALTGMYVVRKTGSRPP